MKACLHTFCEIAWQRNLKNTAEINRKNNEHHGKSSENLNSRLKNTIFAMRPNKGNNSEKQGKGIKEKYLKSSTVQQLNW
ncbi:MAG: hypothetical protein V1659_00150 [Candidatus Woesearchaeota archaeon]